MKNHPTAEDLITALEGPVAIAKLLTQKGHAITPQAVSIWKTTGIPSDRIVQLAFAKKRVLRSGSDVESGNWTRLFPELDAYMARQAEAQAKAG